MSEAWTRKEIIGDATLYLGNCLNVMASIEPVDHVISDPPYEESLHVSKNSLRGRVRVDKGPDLKGLDFTSINKIRADVVECAQRITGGWWYNLREATQSENTQNTSAYSSNKSGFPGVSFHTKVGRWRAAIQQGRKHVHLGYFDTAEQASIAYQSAKVTYHPFSTPNYDMGEME